MTVTNAGRDKSIVQSSGNAMQPFMGSTDASEATLPRTQMTIPIPPPPYTAFPYGGTSGGGGTCGGKKNQSTYHNARGIVLTIIFLLFSILNAVLERKLLFLGWTFLKNINMLVLTIIINGAPLISLLSLVISPGKIFRWVVTLTYFGYALASSFILIINLTRVNVLLYNYLAPMICTLCLAVTWSKGPNAPKSWMPIRFANPAASGDLSV